MKATYPLILILALLFNLKTPLYAQEKAKNPHIGLREYVSWYGQDGIYLLKSPARWKGSQWLTFSGIVAGGALLYARDEQIRNWVLGNHSKASHTVARFAEPLGDGKINFPGMLAFYGASRLFKSPKLEKTSLLVLESWSMAVVLTYAFKLGFHRHRPYYSTNKKMLDGPGLSFKSHHLSFSSGHSATAFAMASVLAYNFRETKWVPVTAYTLAGLTALSRVHDDKHWASDVLIGSSIGYFIGRAIAKRHEDRDMGTSSKVRFGGLAFGRDNFQMAWILPL